MIRGLTRAGLGQVGNDEQFIALAAKHGFQALDLDVVSLTAERGVEGAKALLEEHHIVLGSIGLPVEWRKSEDIFLSGLPKLVQYAALAQQLGGTACCTYILPSTDEPVASFTIAATRRLRLCAQILGAYGIRLGLEFVGPHHLRTAWKHPFLWTMDDTLQWIDAIGEPNVGLLLDCYHWYTNNMHTADIAKLRPEQIVHVHVNDARDVPVEDVLDNDRLITGEGVIDLVGFLRTLKQIGYKGAVAQEVLTRQAPEESADERTERTAKQYDRLFAAAGIDG